MIAAGIIAAVVFVLALSRSAGLADRKWMRYICFPL